jgi:glycosyltransferase involved in cell wall biosynthesis
MRLSIVIPVYNVQEYLCGCVDSVLANDCSDCEIILVDDGCTDGVCPDLCDAIAAEHPDLIRVIHQENRGLGGARNTGLEAAEGEYLFFVDSDDTISADALTILKKAIDETHADVYAFQLYSHDGQGNKTLIQASKPEKTPFSLAEKPEFLLSLPAAWARIWKRDLFLTTGIRYPSRVWYEDIRTSTKLFAAANSIVSLPDVLYWYLQRPGSIMNSGNVLRSREILWAFDDVLAWFREQGLEEKYRSELCRLAVDHILLAAVVRVSRVDPKSELLPELLAYMDEHFSDYKNNPYVPQLSALHKLLLKLSQRRKFGLIRLLFQLKGG